MTINLPLTGAVLAGLLNFGWTTAGRASSFRSQGVPPLPSDAPPLKLLGAESSDRIEHLLSTTPSLGVGAIYGSVRCHMLQKRIAISYYATSGHPLATHLADAIVVEAVSFWPTFVAVLDPLHVAVAGKRGGDSATTGSTVIEIWTLSQPYASEIEAPGPSSPQLSIRNAGVLRKAMALNESVDGRRIVRGMIKNRGGTNRVFVHFLDSGDLYELDYSHAVAPTTPPPSVPFPLVKRLSAAPDPNVPHCAVLGDTRLLWMSGGTHSQVGAVYAIWASFDVQYELGASTPPAIALYDHDVDGLLDEWKQPTLAENSAAGLTNYATYTERHLLSSW